MAKVRPPAETFEETQRNSLSSFRMRLVLKHSFARVPWMQRLITTRWEVNKCDTHLQEELEGDLGSYMPISLTLVPGKVMEQMILNAITWHGQDNRRIIPTSMGFKKADPAWPASFYERLWTLFTETLVKPLAPFPTASSQKNWLLTAWVAAQFAGWKVCGWLSPESGGEWIYIQLQAGHEWCSPRLSTGTV